VTVVSRLVRETSPRLNAGATGRSWCRRIGLHASQRELNRWLGPARASRPARCRTTWH